MLQILFGTYAFYHDRHSRHAVQQCIRAAFSTGAKPESLSAFISTLREEASKPGIAPNNAFVLVEWFSVILQQCAGGDYWPRWGLDVISSDATVLELCQGLSARPGVRLSALVVTRRALRKVLSHQDTRDVSIQSAISRLAAKGIQPTAKNAIMLGVIAGVCSRKSEAKPSFEAQKSEIYGFYTREILGSRTKVPAHIANGLYDFFSEYTTKEDLEKHVVPSLEKSLLRAPEIVLDDLVTPLLKSLPTGIDLSSILRGNLLKPLLSNIKSSNPVIRSGALRAFEAAVSRSTNEEVFGEAADEILNPLKAGKLPSADHRALHSEMLAAIPISNSLAKRVVSSIVAVAAKEVNEVALSAETFLLSQHISWCFSNDREVEKAALDAFSKGISDKKVPLRRLWTLRFGEILWSLEDSKVSSMTALAEAVLPSLLDAWNDTTANPVAAAQSGLVTVAFVLTAVASSKLSLTESAKIESQLKKAQISQQALTFEPKPSFLLNSRIYSKLTSDDDLLWFNRALVATSETMVKTSASSPPAIGWSQAVIFSICATTVSHATRRQCVESLSRMYLRFPTEVADIIVRGLWQWIQNVEQGEKDCAAAASKTENAQLHLVIRAICLPAEEIAQFGGSSVDEASKEKQMISMLVIARPELLPRINWIDLCLRTGVDPGTLARTQGDALMAQIDDITSFKETVCGLPQTRELY